MGRWASFYLGKYIDERKKLFSDDVSLFLNRDGTGGMDSDSLYKTVKKYGIKTGIEKKVSPHALRHTFASHMLSGGADVRSLQELLGHSSVSTTQLYLQVTISELKKVHSKCHPGEKMTRKKPF